MSIIKIFDKPKEHPKVRPVVMNTRRGVHFEKFEDNPIFGLCSKLATYNTRAGILLDEKGEFRRLYHQFGRFLPRTTFKKFKLLTTSEWRSLQDTWIAIMQTVTLNRSFDPLLEDWKLFNSIRTYKLWFVTNILTVTKSKLIDGQRRLIGFKDSITSFGRKAKNLASWLSWYSSGLKTNSRPKPISSFIGWNHQRSEPTLPWLSGHLSKWREPYFRTTTSDLVNFVQIRTFGRALPVPGGNFLREQIQDSISDLSNQTVLSQDVLDAFSSYGNALSHRLGGYLPTHTHISVSTTSCSTHARSQGGKAARVREIIDDLKLLSFHSICSIDSIYVPNGPVYPVKFIELLDRNKVFYDIFGNRLIGSDWLSNPAVYKEIYSDGFDKPEVRDDLTHKLKLLDVFYQAKSNLPNIKNVQGSLNVFLSELDRQTDNDIVLPNNLGKVLLFHSITKYYGYHTIMKYLTYRSPKFWILHPKSGERWLPLWTKPHNSNELLAGVEPEIPPMTRLTVLAEPGMKTRDVTICDVELNIIQQSARFMFEPILTKDPRARIGLVRANKMWDLLKFLQSLKINSKLDITLVNLDYKNATNKMLHSLIQAIWEGLLRRVPTSHPIWLLVPITWSKRTIVPDLNFSDNQPFVSVSGSLQGEPLSFLTLTAYNLILDDIVNHTVRLGLPLYSEIRESLISIPLTGICGDDLTEVVIGSTISKHLCKYIDPRLKTTYKQVDLFSQLIRLVISDSGMAVSPGKDNDSKEVMVFCEDFILCKKGNEFYEFEYLDTIKGRLLSPSSREMTDRKIAALSRGRMVSGQLSWYPNLFYKEYIISLYNNMVRNIHGRDFFSHDYPFHLPPSCGGLGLPINWQDVPHKEQKYIKYVVWLTSQPKTYENISKFLTLRSINGQNRYGIVPPGIQSELIASITGFPVTETFIKEKVVERNTVYSSKFVQELYEERTKQTLSASTYTGRVPYDLIQSAAYILGFVDIWSALDLAERSVTFNALLQNEVKPKKVEYFTSQIRRMNRKWSKIESVDSINYHDCDTSEVHSMEDLDWRCRTYLSGFILREDVYDLISRQGPSLQFDLKRRDIPPSPQFRVKRKVYAVDLMDNTIE